MSTRGKSFELEPHLTDHGDAAFQRQKPPSKRIQPTALAARANSAYLGRKRNFFVLADDPDEGKTVMVGLLLRELKMRGAIECQTLSSQNEMEANVGTAISRYGFYPIYGGNLQ